jgi:hypothetical protein
MIAAQRSVGGLHRMLMREVPSKASSPQSILRAKYLEIPVEAPSGLEPE